MGIRISRKGTKPLIKLILFVNKHTMLHVLRLLTNILKAPPSSKRWDFLRNASNPMKQGRNPFEEMLFITHHTNSHPSKILAQCWQKHELERDDTTSCLHQNLIQSLRHRKASIHERGAWGPEGRCRAAWRRKLVSPRWSSEKERWLQGRTNQVLRQLLRMGCSVVSHSILTRYFDSYDAWWGVEHSSLTRSQYRSRMPPPHPEIVPVAISIDSPVFNSLHKPTHFGLWMIALEHVVHAIRRDGERDAQKLEQTADELLSREENIATRIIGIWRAFRPRSKGTQKIVILQIHFDSN